MAAVVHHGGAGTTTTATRAGTPHVVVPQAADQPHWAGRVTDLGIGAAHDGPTPTTESLSTTLRTALTPETRARATAVASTIRTEGATVAATPLLATRSAEKGRQRPREPREIIEPGKAPGAGLHRQLGMLSWLDEARHPDGALLRWAGDKKPTQNSLAAPLRSDERPPLEACS
jgi:hypothetical protein